MESAQGGKTPPTHVDGVARLKAVVHDLRAPGGCPWDIEQTHDSLLSNLLEEAYEAVDAIRSGDTEHMEEELGDLLLQVVMHAEIAAETDRFNLQSVAHGICEKLIRRHPHVYGAVGDLETEEVLTQWDAIKRAEKGDEQEPMLASVGKGLPALGRAYKLQKKAGKVGFDWPTAEGALEKVREELLEVEEVMEGDPDDLEAELGDLLFSVVNVARKKGFDPEIVLTEANKRFVERFTCVEKSFAERANGLEDASLEEMEVAWQAAKTEK